MAPENTPVLRVSNRLGERSPALPKLSSRSGEWPIGPKGEDLYSAELAAAGDSPRWLLPGCRSLAGRLRAGSAASRSPAGRPVTASAGPPQTGQSQRRSYQSFKSFSILPAQNSTLGRSSACPGSSPDDGSSPGRSPVHAGKSFPKKSERFFHWPLNSRCRAIDRIHDNIMKSSAYDDFARVVVDGTQIAI